MGIEFSDIIFYLLAFMMIGFAVLSVTTRQLFRAAIYLLFSLVSVAGIYFWMEANFVAAVQIIVYVGGIVVLIIFSILLTQQAGAEMPKPSLTKKLWSFLAAGSGLGILLLQIVKLKLGTVNAKGALFDVKAIGRELIDIDTHGWALPFEVVSMLLLAAMIGCIVIALKPGAIVKHEINEP